MLVAFEKITRHKKVAKYTVKEEGPFYCPGCGEEVILKRGVGKINAFAHKTTTTCSYGKQEKELHRRAKMEIYDALIEKGYPTELEHTFMVSSDSPLLIDILVHLPQGKVAIFLDAVKFTTGQLRTVTQALSQAGICAFWGCFIKGSNLKDRYLPYPVEKFARVLSHSTVYYWSGGMTFRGCVFSPYRPKNKTIERTYGKYELRCLDEHKIPLDRVIIESLSHKTLGAVLGPVLLPAML